MKLCSVLGGLKGGLLVLQPLFVDIKWLKHSSHGYHGATVFLLLLLWHQPGINFIKLRLVPEFLFLTCLHLWLLYIIFTSLKMHILIGKITLKSHSVSDKFVQMPKQQKKQWKDRETWWKTSKMELMTSLKFKGGSFVLLNIVLLLSLLTVRARV